MRIFIAGLVAALACGCAAIDGSSLVPGKSTAAEAQALMGKPQHRIDGDGGEKVLLYGRGRQTYAVVLGPDDLVRRVEPRRTRANAARLVAGKSTTKDVQALFGMPERTGRYPLLQRDILEYPFVEDMEYRAIYVQMSYDGVVREVQILVDWSMYSQSLD